MAFTISAAMGTGAVVVGTLILLIPDSLGSSLLGDTWDASRSVLPYAVAGAVGTALGSGPYIVLPAVGVLRPSSIIAGCVAISLPIAGAIGADVNGAVGASLGMAIVQWLYIPPWWYAIYRHRWTWSVQATEHPHAPAEATTAVGSGPTP